MLVIQANPNFDLPAVQRTGFNDFVAALEAETLAYGKPVVLVHGDSHYFRIDKPLRGTQSGGASSALLEWKRSAKPTITGSTSPSIRRTRTCSFSTKGSSPLI
jgi:hypothetical protein